MVWIFSWYTFAENAGDANMNDVVNILYKIFTFLSRWWVIIANLAGKLMTNDIVYGGFLHLDTTLWTFWNAMKNFANFLLGLLVLYSVLRYLLSSVKVSQKLKPLDIIKKTLIGGILIQMSWFLAWIVLDVSTVCTIAISSFPAQFLASSDEFKGSFSYNLDNLVKNKVVVDYKDAKDPIKIEQYESEDLDEDDMNSLIDTLLPSGDSLSWPFIYIWMIIFNFSDYNIQKVEDWGSRKELFLSIWLNGALLVSYSIMMLLIFIFNLMRVLVLWIAIPLMPLLIVASLFDFKQSWFVGEIINFKNLLKLAFKPVILAWALSLILIILVLIRWIITKEDSNVDLHDKNLMIYSEIQDDNTYNSTMDIDGLLDVNMNGFKESFADIIVYILWLCLIYFVMKLSAVKTGIKFIDDEMDKIFKWVKEFATSAPIIPIPWWRHVSINTLSQHLNSDEVFTKAMWIDVAWQEELINNMVGIESDTYAALNSSMGRQEFIDRAHEISYRKWITTVDQLKSGLNSRYDKELYKKQKEWNDNHKSERIDLSDILDDYKKGGGEPAASAWWDASGWWPSPADQS